jgi:hypothetical protein
VVTALFISNIVWIFYNNKNITVLTLTANITVSIITIRIVHWNLKVHYRIYKFLLPIPILNQSDPVYTPTFHFLKIQLNIILPSMPGSSKWSLSLRFLYQNLVYTNPLPHTRYMPHPSHSSRFDNLKNIGSGVKITKVLIMYLPPLTCYPVPLRPKYYPRHPILKQLCLHASLKVSNQASHP